MNNENNDGFLPGVDPFDNGGNNGAPQNFDPNIVNPNAPFDMNNQNPNMEPNQFDPNMNQGFDPNMNGMFDPNMNNGFGPNMGQAPFDMNAPMPGIDPNQFDPNANGSFDQNMNANFNPNMNQNFDSNINDGFAQNMNENFDTDMNQNFDPNVNNGFDPNMNNGFDPNMGQAPFDMNAPMPGIDPNQFNPNAGFDQNMNGGFDPNMNQNFGPNMNGEFDPNMNNNFDQGNSSNYEDEFERQWMGTIYEKAHSKKFNFCAAFFGPAYLFYRKVYLTGGLTTLILIIVNIIIALLKISNLGLLLGINFFIMLAYFFGLGFGFYPIYRDFVHKQFEKYKKQIPDNNQLVAVASKKGRTSILSLILYYVVVSVVSTVMVTVVFASLIHNIFSSVINSSEAGNITSNQINNTDIDEDTSDTFEFADGYTVSYPSDTWSISPDENSLIKGGYTLSYSVSYTASALGVTDFSSSDSRSSILQIINASVTALATANNLQMDANENFVFSNSAYYTYINLSGDTEITRYYFVLVPSEGKLFQFELNINDTAIDPGTHLEVVKMLTEGSTDDTSTPDISNNTNGVSNDVADSNVIYETTSNNSTADNNTISSNNTTTDNPARANVLSNTTV